MEWTESIIWVTVIVIVLGGGFLIVFKGMTMHQSKEIAEINSSDQIMMRKLAEEATVAQRRTAEEMTEVRLAMVDIRDRVYAIEKLMSEVG